MEVRDYLKQFLDAYENDTIEDLCSSELVDEFYAKLGSAIKNKEFEEQLNEFRKANGLLLASFTELKHDPKKYFAFNMGRILGTIEFLEQMGIEEIN